MRYCNTVKIALHLAFALSAQSTATSGLEICPLLGQQYPSPRNLVDDHEFQNACSSLAQTINSNLSTYPYNVTTFSIGMFSTFDQSLSYEYHHTDSSVANSTQGTRKVNASSIYRIASITKVLLLYLYLIRTGDRLFNYPITDFIPELKEKQPSLRFPTPSWDEITLGELADQSAGLARDYGLNDLSPDGYARNLFSSHTRKAFPVFSSEDAPVCNFFTSNLSFVECDFDQYLEGVATEAAIFASGSTPTYSNTGFALLGLALGRIANISVESLFNQTIVDALGLEGTTWTVPHNVTKNSVIPGGDQQASGWNNSLGLFAAAAGAFSSTNDLAMIGKAIMSHSLLSGSVTRRWLTPARFVEGVARAVGRPWEIFRLNADGNWVTLFTKAGDWGVYHSVFLLIPDYNFGMTLLAASAKGAYSLRENLPNLLVDKILPVLEKIAKKQAEANFAGTYWSTTSNTSVTITTDSRPALKVTKFISNGVDMLDKVFSLFGKPVDFRILPNNLYDGNLIGFTGVYQGAVPPPRTGRFYGTCETWLDVDDFTWNNVPLGQFVFELDGCGKSMVLNLTAFEQSLFKK